MEWALHQDHPDLVVLLMRGPSMVWSLALGAGLAASVSASFEYHRAVGTGDVVPGAPEGTRFSYVAVPQLGGDFVAFYGESFPGGEWLPGYYLWDGRTTHRLADPTMVGELPGTTPGTSLTFAGQAYDVDATGLATFNLEGSEASQPYYAVLGWRDGVTFPIAINGQAVPGDPSATFIAFGQARAEGGRVVFAALASSAPIQSRVFEWSEGVLRELPLPDGADFVGGGGGPIRGADEVVALAIAPPDPAAVWRWETHTEAWRPIFSFSTPFPGGIPADRWVPNGGQQMGIIEDGVVLQARASITPGVWGMFRLTESAGPELVVGPGWTEPDTGQTGMDLHSDFSSSGDRVVFSAHRPDQVGFYGVYLQEADRSFHTIAVPGMMLGDVEVGSTHISAGSLDGSRVAFAVGSFTDDAIWIADLEPSLGVADIPTAGGAALAGMVLLLAACAFGILGKKRRVLR